MARAICGRNSVANAVCSDCGGGQFSGSEEGVWGADDRERCAPGADRAPGGGVDSSGRDGAGEGAVAALALIGWEWLISLCSAMHTLEDQKQCAPWCKGSPPWWSSAPGWRRCKCTRLGILPTAHDNVVYGL